MYVHNLKITRNNTIRDTKNTLNLLIGRAQNVLNAIEALEDEKRYPGTDEQRADYINTNLRLMGFLNTGG